MGGCWVAGWGKTKNETNLGQLKLQLAELASRIGMSVTGEVSCRSGSQLATPLVDSYFYRFFPLLHHNLFS